MFTKFSASAIILALVGSAVAQCNTGSLQCCNSMQNYNSTTVANLLSPLDVVLQGLTGQAGITCSPITVLGGGLESNCDAHPVCCIDNSRGNLISLGCIPFSLG
ncbi:hypothetical protein JAAARDRAFT_190066 [Jaapia argillacea MUCL 33604]|uniref:Hydrophobin n=1 Tax=Jaapia argillacea MUCL 33604 TaxID=933084 RepID=A0A067QJJ8_9AGAM|nr:hypothetical protein JAAARDRAFT_190066 [Jaapia argillacea MUCL 33604]